MNEFSDCDREQLNNDEMAKLCKSSNVKMYLKMIFWSSDWLVLKLNRRILGFVFYNIIVRPVPVLK